DLPERRRPVVLVTRPFHGSVVFGVLRGNRAHLRSCPRLLGGARRAPLFLLGPRAHHAAGHHHGPNPGTCRPRGHLASLLLASVSTGARPPSSTPLQGPREVCALGSSGPPRPYSGRDTRLPLRGVSALRAPAEVHQHPDVVEEVVETRVVGLVVAADRAG